jgi:hypothetical protein
MSDILLGRRNRGHRPHLLLPDEILLAPTLYRFTEKPSSIHSAKPVMEFTDFTGITIVDPCLSVGTLAWL